MKLIDYVKDKKKFIVYYFFMMIFISMIFFLSNSQQDKLSNIVYINLVGLIFTGIYILSEYLGKKDLYKEIEDITQSDKPNLIKFSSKFSNNELKLFIRLFNHLQENNKINIEKLYDEKKEYEDFIVSWVHEIKLPIATSKLILSNSNVNTNEYLVDKIEDEIMKIDNYVEQVLYYSRIDTFSNDYFIEEIEVSKFIKGIIKKYAKIFINKKIKVKVFESKEYIHSDIKWISYIVEQIIYNSLKYTNENGCISIDFEEDNLEKRLIIKDNGIGIASQDINRVFDKGFTGSIGRKYYKSTGMGLYLSNKMAKKLGHDILIKSKEGDYTKVSIIFYKVDMYNIL